MEKMTIRLAQTNDFEKLYNIGLSTPELGVSAIEPFMAADEFKWAIKEKENDIFLVAEDAEKIAGFIYANTENIEKSLKSKWACLMYIVVVPNYRGRGVAKLLYDECEKCLRKKGITHLYTWASVEGDTPIVSFFKKQGLAEGHAYRWMDKKL